MDNERLVMLINRVAKSREQVEVLSEGIHQDIEIVRSAIADGSTTGDRVEDFIYYCVGYQDDLEVLPSTSEKKGTTPAEREQFRENCRRIRDETRIGDGEPVLLVRSHYAQPNELGRSGICTVSVLYEYELAVLAAPPLQCDFQNKQIKIRTQNGLMRYQNGKWKHVQEDPVLSFEDLLVMSRKGLETLTLHRDEDPDEVEKRVSVRATHLVAGTEQVELLFSVGYSTFFSGQPLNPERIERVASRSHALDRNYFKGARLLGIEPSPHFKRRYMGFLAQRRPVLLKDLYSMREHRETIADLMNEALDIDLHHSPIELEVEPGVRVRAEKFVRHLCEKYDIVMPPEKEVGQPAQ